MATSIHVLLGADGVRLVVLSILYFKITLDDESLDPCYEDGLRSEWKNRVCRAQDVDDARICLFLLSFCIIVQYVRVYLTSYGNI